MAQNFRGLDILPVMYPVNSVIALNETRLLWLLPTSVA